MMSDIFISGSLSMLSALGRIFIVIIGAGILVRLKIISEKDVQSLSKVTVLVLLPALIFSKTVTTFEPAAMPFYWQHP